ncbi:MAG: spore cortex biosynthesis protein YabQ [Clostridia bacterium]|nr:spore cortex biosynthesis protein YabQ [Clostridia bacterium]
MSGLEYSMGSLVLTAFYSVGLGFFLGAFYEVVRILRIAVGITPQAVSSPYSGLYRGRFRNVFPASLGKTFSVIFVSLTDLLYFTASGVVFSVFLYRFNYGIFRWFFLVALVLGFLLYYHTVGKAVPRMTYYCAETVRFAVNLSIFAAKYPFIKLFSAVRFVYGKTLAPVVYEYKNRIDKRRKKRYTDKCMEELIGYFKEQV